MTGGVNITLFTKLGAFSSINTLDARGIESMVRGTIETRCEVPGEQIVFQWGVAKFAEKEIDVLLDIILIRIEVSKKAVSEMIQELEGCWKLLDEDKSVQAKSIAILVRRLR